MNRVFDVAELTAITSAECGRFVLSFFPKDGSGTTGQAWRYFDSELECVSAWADIVTAYSTNGHEAAIATARAYCGEVR